MPRLAFPGPALINTGRLASETAPLVRLRVTAALESAFFFCTRSVAGIHSPLWQDDLSEEYFVCFTDSREVICRDPDRMLEAHADGGKASCAWRTGRSVGQEIGRGDARVHSLIRNDILVPDGRRPFWSDADAKETCWQIEFANLATSEFRPHSKPSRT